MAIEFTQENRRLRIGTPLGPEALLLTELSGHEGISTLFAFEAQLIGQEPSVDFDAIVGKPVSIEIGMSGGDRYVHGIVSRFSQSGTVDDHGTYRAEIVPWLWFLTRTTDCRIFQKKSVPDIVRDVFGEYGFNDFSLRLQGAFEPREYCVQYRETDFNFIARLLEEEGIFFFFEHSASKHVLVLANTPSAHGACPALSEVRWVHESGGADDDDVVTWFRKQQEVRASKYTATDYNFETPSLDLASSATGQDPRKYELYDFPAGVQKRDGVDRLVRIRQQEEDATRVLFDGASYCRSFTPGYTFSLTGVGAGAASTFDGRYLLASVRHRASESVGEGDGGGISYENDFQCIPASVPFRPARHTARPVINGVQTAVVVGPRGEEIFTDKYGRVKVQFFWDREGKRDENSSCWVRVSQAWAGKGWGGVTIPRIGQEVIVSFLEGDPDLPIITGRVYNAEQMPPYALPNGGVVSGFKTQTHKGAGYNELSMDDSKGKERITIHGQYDMNTTVEHDKTEKIGHDETISIGNNRTEDVSGNETLSVAKDRKRNVAQNEYVEVTKNRTHTVGQDETIEVAANQKISVGKAQRVSVGKEQEIGVEDAQRITVGKEQSVSVGTNQVVRVEKTITTEAGQDMSVTIGKKLVLDAGDAITIKTGSAVIEMKKNGDITIQGNKITVKGSGDVVVKGSKILAN